MAARGVPAPKPHKPQAVLPNEAVICKGPNGCARQMTKVASALYDESADGSVALASRSGGSQWTTPTSAATEQSN